MRPFFLKAASFFGSAALLGLAAAAQTAAPAPAKPRIIDIEQGKKHWAFLPLKPMQPPNALHTGAAATATQATAVNWNWCQTPIDHFLLAKLAGKGLAPNPQADRRTLIRRAYFDLIGLPPNLEEVQAFLTDAAPDAWNKVIDHLLASPHYGERWGRYWLDLARFAESHGFEHDYDRPSAYVYRDFVIRALNADMPYDQFVRWQLAGDEFAPENPLALAATGFLAAGVHSTQITKNQAEKERYDELDDMASTTGTAMLGLTVGCARCHDHKYDPIPTKDYYRLISTFTTTVRSEMDMPIDPEGDKRAKARFEAEHAPLEAALAQYEKEQLPARLADWLKNQSLRSSPMPWAILEVQDAKSAGGAAFTPQPDGSLLATGKNPDFDTYTFVTRTGLQNITAVRLEALADPSLVKGGPGRAGNGNFALTDLRMTARPAKGPGQAVEVKLRNPRATFEQPGLPVRAVNSDPKSAWAVDPQFGKDHAAVFDTEAPLGFAGGTILTFTLKFENNTGHNIGRPRLSVTTSTAPLALTGPGRPERVERLLAGNAVHFTDWSEADKTVLLTWYRSVDPGWQALHKAVEAHLALAPKPTLQKMLVCSEGVPAVRLHTQGEDFLPETYFLKRGDPNQKMGVATAGFLQVLERGNAQEAVWQTPPPPGWRTSYRRRGLANWMTDVEKGAGALLARVMVNRLWQHHFGRPLVATASDFGTQAEMPAHLELLDWLASELIRNGWQLKPLHRLMLQSAAYRQSDAASPKALKIDPENKLCWRQMRRRLEAEAFRDSLLAVSSALDETMFGPGTLDESMTRRSIYFTVKRSSLIPMLRLFDAPDALLGVGSRSTTTIAPQALLLMNSPHIRDYALRLAKRALPTAGTPMTEAVNTAYRLTLSRPPTEREKADTLAFLQQQTASYQASGASEPSLSALADFCRTLMSLNEFIYID